jgi:hypothetical protein
MEDSNNSAVEVTPDIAAEWLKENVANRPIRPKHKQQLATTMARNLWKLNGESIKFDSYGRLIDGQHRLLAIIESGKTVPLLVVRGLDPDVVPTIGCGVKRSAADALHHIGEVNCKKLASAIVLVDRYYKMRLSFGWAYSNTDILELLEQHPGIRRSVVLCMRCPRFISERLASAAHYLFSRKSETAADEFMKQLFTGVALKQTDPIYLLREKLASNAASKSKLSVEYLLMLMIKAWNAYRSGTPIKTLRFREQGEAPESYPAVT